MACGRHPAELRCSLVLLVPAVIGILTILGVLLVTGAVAVTPGSNMVVGDAGHLEGGAGATLLLGQLFPVPARGPGPQVGFPHPALCPMASDGGPILGPS